MNIFHKSRFFNLLTREPELKKCSIVGLEKCKLLIGLHSASSTGRSFDQTCGEVAISVAVIIVLVFEHTRFSSS